MSSNDTSENVVWRVLDANLNRLREALRVVEEHARFVLGSAQITREVKSLRHEVRGIEEGLDRRLLLLNRNTTQDPLSRGSTESENRRRGVEDVLRANLKRAQEAARAIEEYAKVVNTSGVSDRAKVLRFGLYALEQRMGVDRDHGQEQS